ncbi:MAG: hypothetical protein B6245_01515 [Desulfobacteraceae bacterium 4572_88]|nr:MAG: hypothetical protein B6245_01515 [Desulfobacteraceae bacterium 4572_88]
MQYAKNRSLPSLNFCTPYKWVNIRVVLQELMGHADLKTSEIYSEKQEIWKAFFQVPDQKFSRSVKMKFSHDKNSLM